MIQYTMQVQHFARATLTHRQWHLNYYHSIAESILDVYNLACMYFQLCNLHTRDDVIPIFLDRPGVAGWDARLGVTEGGWRQVLPPAAEALQCFYPKPALWVADPMLHDKVQTSFLKMQHVYCVTECVVVAPACKLACSNAFHLFSGLLNWMQSCACKFVAACRTHSTLQQGLPFSQGQSTGRKQARE